MRPLPAVTAALLFATAAVAAVAATPAPTADVYMRDIDGNDSLISASGPNAIAELVPTVVDTALYGGLQRSVHRGLASAQTQTLRTTTVLSTLHPDAPALFAAKTESAFSKQVQILPGNSGLAMGDPISFQVQVRVDGFAGAGLLDPSVFGGAGGGAASSTRRSLASVDMRLDYAIRDLDQPVCGEGCFPKRLLGWGYWSFVDFDAMDQPWTGAWGSIDSGWTRGGTLVAGQPTPNRYSFQSSTILANDAVAHYGDTGLIVFTLDSFVGHTLEVEGSLDVFVQAMGQGTLSQAAGRFGNTFDAGLLSTSGVEFTNEIAGVTPVPEPSGWMLGLAGLTLLGWRARRQR